MCIIRSGSWKGLLSAHTLKFKKLEPSNGNDLSGVPEVGNG